MIKKILQLYVLYRQIINVLKNLYGEMDVNEL